MYLQSVKSFLFFTYLFYISNSNRIYSKCFKNRTRPSQTLNFDFLVLDSIGLVSLSFSLLSVPLLLLFSFSSLVSSLSLSLLSLSLPLLELLLLLLFSSVSVSEPLFMSSLSSSAVCMSLDSSDLRASCSFLNYSMEYFFKVNHHESVRTEADEILQ